MNKSFKQLNPLNHKIITIIIIAIICVAYYGQKSLSSSSNSTDQNTNNTQIANVKRGDLQNTVSASGTIETANYLSVTTSVNGIVKQVFVKEGDKIAKGQKIMEITLDSEGEQAKSNAYSSYLRAKNSLTSAQNNLYSLQGSLLQKEQAFDEIKENSTYQTEEERYSYKISENAYNSAQNEINNKKSEIAQLQVALTTAWGEYQAQSPIITAPSDGVISNIVAVQGTQISNSVSERSVKTVASIKKEGSPIATLNITELDIGKIKVGQKVLLTLNSLSNDSLLGSVVGIDKVGTSESGVANYPITVKFDSPNDSVLPNMSVDGDVVISEVTNVLYIPTSAVNTNSDGSNTVLTIKNGQQEMVSIETGITSDSKIEVKSGIAEGDEVIINTLPTTGFTTSSSGQQRTVIGGFGGFGR